MFYQLQLYRDISFKLGEEAKGPQTRQFLCPDGRFDRLATLLFDTQSNIIKTLMASKLREILLQNVIIFCCVWYAFVCVTSGTAVPIGIFIPCILIGCSLGHIYSHLHQAMGFKVILKPDDTEGIYSGIFAILGATAVLSGSTRMTYSLAVIMLETTSSVELFLPIIFTLFMSYGTGALLINKSIYLSALRSKNIPLLTKDLPKENRRLLARQAMTAPPICFKFVTTVRDVYYQLEMTTHNGFPVLDRKDRLIGLVERDVLITLIQKMAWYNMHTFSQLKILSLQIQLYYPTDDKVPMFGDGVVIKREKNSTFHRAGSLESQRRTLRVGSTETQNQVDSSDQKNQLLMNHQSLHNVSNPSQEQQEQLIQQFEQNYSDTNPDQSDFEDLCIKNVLIYLKDFKSYPLQDDKIAWQDLNQDFTSTIKNFKIVEEKANSNPDKLLDLRPYMIEKPYLFILQIGNFQIIKKKTLIIIQKQNTILQQSRINYLKRLICLDKCNQDNFQQLMIKLAKQKVLSQDKIFLLI